MNTRRTKKRDNPEHREQAALIRWRDLAMKTRPELKMLFAIPNAGGYTGNFKSNMLRVIKMKKEGLVEGVPDLFLAVSRGCYHGLFIEMKAAGNKCTDEQVAFLNHLRHYGYAATVWWKWTDAKNEIEWYLALDRGR